MVIFFILFFLLNDGELSHLSVFGSAVLFLCPVLERMLA